MLVRDEIFLLLRQNWGQGGVMKLLKGLLTLVLIGVVVGFVISLLTPNMDLASADFGDDEDSEF